MAFSSCRKFGHLSFPGFFYHVETGQRISLDSLLVFEITFHSLLYILGLKITKKKFLNLLTMVLDTFIGEGGRGRAILGGGIKRGEQNAKLLALVRLTQVPLANVLEPLS